MKPFTHLHIYHLIIYLVIGLFSTSVFASDITPNEAIRIANDFVQQDKTAQANIRRAPAGTRVNPSIAHKMPSRVAQNKDNVYIINLGGNQGFVVVSGETGTVELIPPTTTSWLPIAVATNHPPIIMPLYLGGATFDTNEIPIGESNSSPKVSTR